MVEMVPSGDTSRLGGTKKVELDCDKLSNKNDNGNGGD